MNLREQAAALKAQMKSTVAAAKSSGRDLTAAEADDIERKAGEYEALIHRAEKADQSAALVASLASAPTSAPDDLDVENGERTPGSGTKAARSSTGSPWAKSVMKTLEGRASSLGLKALVSGEINTPPAVTVVDLPTVPTRLLDLVPRQPLDEKTYSYLREVTRAENVGVVPDGGTKPTSVYTFEEVEDRARVVAHMSEPFPMRFLSDHQSMIQVLDGQMRTGIERKLEQQVVAGDGLGENFTGILETSGVVDVPFDSNTLRTIRKARTALEVLGEVPTAWVLNPTDIEAFELEREDGATGGFLMVHGAFDAVFGPGVTRVTSPAVPQGTAILADWKYVRLMIRENVGTLIATQSGDLFETNRVKLRTEGRFGIEILRPSAFAVVHLAAV